MVYVSSLLAKQPESRLISTSAARAGALNLANRSRRLRSGDPGELDLARRHRYRSMERRYHERLAAGETLTRETYISELAADAAFRSAASAPEEVSAAIAFLSSPLCGFMTGTS